jgi:hypothetical protein
VHLNPEILDSLLEGANGRERHSETELSPISALDASSDNLDALMNAGST